MQFDDVIHAFGKYTIHKTQTGYDLDRQNDGDVQSLMRAVVLVGGFGTRLRPLTFTTPKPMLPVGHRPIVENLVRMLSAAGFAVSVGGNIGVPVSAQVDASTADTVHVMAQGRVVKSGGKELALELEAKGYDWVKKAV